MGTPDFPPPTPPPAGPPPTWPVAPPSGPPPGPPIGWWYVPEPAAPPPARPPKAGVAVLAVIAVIAAAVLIGGTIVVALRDDGATHTAGVVEALASPGTVIGPPSTQAPPSTLVGPPRAETSDADLVAWADLLALIPDEQQYRDGEVAIYDYARDRMLKDVELPAVAASDDELAAYESDIGFVQPPLRPAQPTDLRIELGFDVADLDQVMQIGDYPTDIIVARGRFDARDIAEAVHSDPDWSPLLSISSYRGAAIYAWGEDGGVTNVTSGLRPEGESRRLAVFGDFVAWAPSLAAVHGVVDAWIGLVPALGSRPEIQTLAGIGDTEECLIGLLFPSAAGYAAAATDPTSDSPTVGAPQAAIVGVSLGTASTAHTAALLYTSASEASDNASTLAASLAAADPAWSDVFAVETAGATLVVRQADITPPQGTAPLAFPPPVG